VPSFFFDSSAIVKRYVSETGTNWVVQQTHPRQRNGIYLARTAGVEVVSAITRRHRSGTISAPVATQVLADFRFDFSTQYRLVGITPRLIQSAMRLVEAHGLRGYDAIQLAAALQAHSRLLARQRPALTLISADIALNAAAVIEGLPVDDPNNHP